MSEQGVVVTYAMSRYDYEKKYNERKLLDDKLRAKGFFVNGNITIEKLDDNVVFRQYQKNVGMKNSEKERGEPT